MINRILKLVTLLSMFCLCATIEAASEAEYKKLSKTWQLNADGSQEYRYQMELTLFTHTAMNSTYGESFIVYNPQYQELKINASYTKQKDGTIVSTPENAFVEVLPKNAANAPAYNHLKEMVVVHTGLELGATIYLDYTLKSKAGYLPALDVFETVAQTSPVKEYKIEMITPENSTLSYALTYKRSKPSVQVEKGMRHTSWTLHNVPASSKEDFVNIENGDVPYLAATTFNSKKHAFDILERQFANSSNSVLTALAQQLTKGKDAKDEQIKAIWQFVNRQIASNPLTLEQTGYRIRPVETVLNSVYGTEAEKLNLFVGLLNAVRIPSEAYAYYPVANPEGLGLRAIQHFYVSIEGTPYLLNTNDLSRPSNVEFGILPVYRLADGECVQSTKTSQYEITGTYQMEVTKDKVTVGTREMAGESLLNYFQEESAERTQPNPLRWTSGYATVILPESNHGITHLSYGKLNSRREQNIMLPRMVDEHYTYNIVCAEGIALCTPVKETTIDNAAGKMSLSIKKSGAKITVERRLVLNKQLFTPSEFKELRILLTAWNDQNAKTLLFSEK